MNQVEIVVSARIVRATLEAGEARELLLNLLQEPGRSAAVRVGKSDWVRIARPEDVDPTLEALLH